MVQASEFPAIFKVSAGDGRAAANKVLSDIDYLTAEGRRKLRNFSAEAQDQLDRALSVQRNNAGSLDLGVDELNRAAVAQQQRAIAAREVADATLRAAKAEGGFNVEMRESVAAARQLAQAEEAAAASMRAQAAAADAVQKELNQSKSAIDAVVAAEKRGTTARGSVVNSVRAERVAFVQLGQQMQDVTVQAQMGTNAMTIFAQQVPQAAFALSGLSNSANATKARIGALATFMSGPWGAAIFAATAVLGPLIYNLLQTGDAAEEAEKKSYDFSRGLAFLSEEARRTSGAMQQLQQEMRSAIAIQGNFLRSNQLVAQGDAEALRRRLALHRAVLKEEQAKGEGLGFLFPTLNGVDRFKISYLKEQIARDTEVLKATETAIVDGALAIQQQSLIESRDPVAAARGQFERDVAQLNERRRRTLENSNDPLFGVNNPDIVISEEQYNAELGRLLDLKKGAEEAAKAGGRRGGRSRDRGARQAAAEVRRAQQLAEFAEDAGKKIANLRDQFSDIPSEVAKSNKAVRELNDIISDLDRRKPEGFADLVVEAEKLRDLIPTIGIDRAVADMTEDFNTQLGIRQLILEGREDEAEVLGIMLDLEDRFGAIARERKGEIEDIVEARRREFEELERIEDLQNAYLSATQSLRGELESLFSGDGFDLESIGKRLTAQIQVETIFGDALREIDEVTKSGFSRNVDALKLEVDRSGDALSDFTEALAIATERVINPDIAAPAAGVSAANDNSTDIDGTIIVNGTTKGIENSRTIIGMTPLEYAELVGDKLTNPLLRGLEDAVGPKLAASLQGVLSGAIAGNIVGGEVGAVIGALRGIEGLPEGISKVLDDALGGAATGSTVNGILGAFGIETSKTGSQIGGALGAATGLPGGDIVGALAGGIIGKLIGSAKRGSATVTGVDNAISTRGNSSSRREAALGLGGGIQDAIRSIADQLDAEIGSFAVSIGVRDDNFRVDRSGRGITKTKNGAVDFGQDEAAAIAFAVGDAIADGAIRGLTAAENRLLRANKDIEDAIADVLTFRGVFDELRERTDPVGFAISELNKEFEDLIDLFTRAGATSEEFADLEELYALRRAEALEGATERVVGSLQDLINDLTIGDNGLSLRDRRNNALDEYTALRARVESGDTSAIDDYAEAAQTLLDLERQIFGSQEQYFDRFDEILAFSRSVVSDQERLIQDAVDLGSPFDSRAANDNEAVISSIERLGDRIVDALGVVNGNIVTQFENGGGLGGGRPIDILDRQEAF